jgi:DNA-binding transcriptional LysR family regulator
VELRQLRYLVEIVERGGFTPASRAIRVAQPALTTAIQKLEREIGARLLDRDARPVTLTADGRAFHSAAQEILLRVRALEREMQERRGLERGQLSVALPVMLATHALASVIDGFRARHPGIALSVETSGARTIETRLAAGEVDLGIVSRQGVREDLVYRPLLRDEVVACVARRHPLAAKAYVTLESVAAEPLLLFRRGFFQRDLVMSALEERGLNARVVFESDHVPLLVAAATSGAGVTTLLRVAARSEKELVPLSFRPALFVEAGLAWKEGAWLSHAARAFVDFVTAADLPGAIRGSPASPRGQRRPPPSAKNR